MAKFLSWQGLEEYTGLIKTFVNNLHNDLIGKINEKADSSHTHPISNITNLKSSLDGKSDVGHTHNYAGSSSVGGAATSANKLNTNAGSGTQPVYFANGVPVATTYTLGKSVPSDAKFTDTTYSVATTSANGLMSADDKKKVNTMSGSHSLGSFGSKTVADLRAALDTWLGNYCTIANSSAIFTANPDWITAWNSGNTSATISAGGQWIVTNIATYPEKTYAQLRFAYYSDKQIAYVVRVNGAWGPVRQTAFKDDLDLKQDKLSFTANRAIVSDANGKPVVSATTSNEIWYLSGAKSNIQTQLDGKSDSTHTHNTTYIPDTRTENMTPIEYINKYPKQVITEFKQQNSIGLSNSASYCKLTTYVQLADNSGGYPSQEAIIDGRLFTRQGTSDTTWGAWKTNVDSGNIGSQSVASATTASKVTVTATNPSSQTGYYFPFHSGSDTGNKSLLTNDGIKYLSQQGTTSAAGAGELVLGNRIASGTAGNKKGGLTMFGTSSGYTYISPTNNTTNNIAVNLPSTGGTLALNTAATQSANGLMSAADKKKLDGIATGANKITVDTALSGTSTNPVQNKVINAALAGKADAHSHPYLSTSGGTLSGNLVATGYSIEAGTLYSYGHVTAAGDMGAKTIYENGTALSSKYAPLSHSHSQYYTEWSSPYFTGICVGSGNPYIYSNEGNNLNFRWYWNNTWRYYSMEDIYTKLVLGGAITHGYLTIQNDAITSSTNSVSLRRNSSSTDGFIVAGNCRPLTDNVMTSGSSSYRWKQLYAATTTINTSDRNAKRDFRTFDSNENYEKFFMDLKPLVFKFKDGESKRDHFGFVSQDVEDSLYKYNFDDKSFAGFCKDVKVEYIEDEDGNGEEIPVLDENGNEQYIYGLRYSEFTALNTYMIQKVVKENQEFKVEIAELKEENQKLIAEIKNIIAELKG